MTLKASVTVAQRDALGFMVNCEIRRLKVCFTGAYVKQAFSLRGVWGAPIPRALPEATVNKALGLTILPSRRRHPPIGIGIA